MTTGGAPTGIAERVAALYAQEQAMCNPPPLPPRPVLVMRDHSPLLPSAKTYTRRNILIVDSYNNYESLMVQYHLELIRMWTANNGGPWIFHRVDSAGLFVRTPWRQDGGGTITEDKNTFSIRPGRFSPDPTPDFSSCISLEPPFFKTDDPPFECDQS